MQGDALHQMIDCMFLGPYARVNYLIADDNDELETLAWFRDAGGGINRSFDLPCSGVLFFSFFYIFLRD